MPADAAQQLARPRRAYLVAAAGCGKTEAVARAAGIHSEGRQLVLTHTHAGVKALKDRLQKVHADRGRVHVDTIAGFALRYAASFPTLSGLPTTEPSSTEEWTAAYEAARRVFDTRVGRGVLAESYAGMFVDEYQDCVLPQHELVMAMADVLPCRTVLDPLQGIFGFAGPLVSCDDHLAPTFDRLPDLVTPIRWRDSNPDLGDWLVGVRGDIEAGRPLDLDGAPIRRVDVSPASQVRTCFKVAQSSGSVVAIGQWPRDCHRTAQRLRGVFTVMEPIECQDLVTWSERLEGAIGPTRAAAVIDFASVCMTQVGTQLRTAAGSFRAGNMPTLRASTPNRAAIEALSAVALDPTLDAVAAAMAEIEAIPGAKLHRRELWREMVRAIRAHAGNHDQTLTGTAWHVRDGGRYGGRRVEPRTVSRTVLVKGLEFDHAVVLNADVHDGPNLYVALTRGSRSLTVLSRERVMRPAGSQGHLGRAGLYPEARPTRPSMPPQCESAPRADSRIEPCDR